MSEFWQMTATDAVAQLKAGEVTPGELIDAAQARIEAVDGAVNAIPTCCFDRAREHAAAVDPDSLLAGLPIVIKDLTDVGGVRTTYGSPIFSDNVPAASDIVVETLEANGGLVIGKSNTPEFGAGANTFNPVFGATRNPWDTRMSAAGSSGGAAVALATGQAWLAQGTDLGGSLRTPAGFNSVVGLRPSVGRVARSPGDLPWDSLAVTGPMARTVADVALMLDAMVGFHPSDPISLPAPALPFLEALADATAPLKVAWSADLGFTEVDREIATITAQAAARFSDLGADVVEAAPSFAGAFDAFQTLRALRFANALAPLLERARSQIKPDVIWNIEKGLALTADEIGKAERDRAALFRRVAAFFEDHDLLACPVMQAPPYAVEATYVDSINGKQLDSYIDWISITFAITLTGCPALSLPCGFTETGLPVGLQLVGKPRGEAALLAAAAKLEGMLGIAEQLPIDPRVRHDQ